MISIINLAGLISKPIDMTYGTFNEAIQNILNELGHIIIWILCSNVSLSPRDNNNKKTRDDEIRRASENIISFQYVYILFVPRLS